MDPAPSTTVGIRELRQHASRYVDMAAGGQRVPVTKRGQVVAYLVPASDTTSPLMELTAAGLLSPPTNTSGHITDLEPVRLPPGQPSVSDALRGLRDEERW